MLWQTQACAGMVVVEFKAFCERNIYMCLGVLLLRRKGGDLYIKDCIACAFGGKLVDILFEMLLVSDPLRPASMLSIARSRNHSSPPTHD